MSATEEISVAWRLLSHVRDGTSDREQADLRVPVDNYVSAKRARQERQLFLEEPLLATTSAALRSVGEFVTLDLIGVPVLLVRQRDGTVAGFLNICRHRGGRVEQETAGAKRVFTCRYHGWTYDGDGALRSIPHREGFESVDETCSGLMRLPTAERNGLVWVRLAGDELIDPVTHLGPDLDRCLADIELGDWEPYLEEWFDQPVNWKLVADGLLDVLHPRFLHPDSVGRLLQSHAHVWSRHGRHGRLSMARKKLTHLGDAGIADDELRGYVITNYFVYPNTMLVVQPDHYELWSVFPDADAPDRSRTVIRFLAPPRMTDADRSAVDRSWEILRHAVLEEDWPMAQSIQGAARVSTSGSSRPELCEFVYGRDEVPAQHLHRRLEEDLAALVARSD